MSKRILHAAFLFLAGCASLPKPQVGHPPRDPAGPPPSYEAAADPAVGAAVLLDRMNAALGGREAIRAAKTEQIDEVRVQFDEYQGPLPSDHTVISRTRLRLSHDFERHDLVIEQRHMPDYPYRWDFDFRDVIAVGARGWVDGTDTPLGTSSRPASPARIAMRLKEQLLQSPVLLMREVLTSPEAIRDLSCGAAGGVPTCRFTAVWRGMTLSLLVDAAAGRLLRLETQEDQPAFGDVTYQVSYEDWRPADSGLILPHRLVHRLAGNLVQVDEVTAVAHGVPFEAEVPSSFTRVSDPAMEALGFQRSRFFFDWMGYGFPQDAAPSTFPLNFQEVSAGVFLVTGGFHNSMVVDLGGGELVLVEAPFTPERSEALLAKIAERWPNGHVTRVISTHRHTDHIGGMRPLIARGAEIILPVDEAPVVQAMADHAKTLFPDALARAPVAVRLLPVNDRYTITGKDRSIEVYAIDSIHAEQMLVVYLPKEKVLFNADLMNPGFYLITHGLKGVMIRTALRLQYPQSMLKAGTYAQDLERAITRLGLDVQRICGGHGPEIAARSELSLLASYGNREKFEKLPPPGHCCEQSEPGVAGKRPGQER